MKKQKSIVGLWSSLFRALEIAKTGGYSVSVYFNDDYKQGFADYQFIKKFCEGWFDYFAVDGDIKTGIHKNYNNSDFCDSNFETLDDIQSRINKHLEFPKPDTLLCNASRSILNNAAERLELSFSEIEKAICMSATIAQMDFSEKIQPCHIAEAVNYSFYYDNDKILINAEEPNMFLFGDMIKINKGDIFKDHAQQAITYLKTFI